jgi:uncharacterized RDD family membrane protein YckC/Tfp pilus assembly major pilin PilA
MFCSRCGKELTSEARYCAHCGAPAEGVLAAGQDAPVKAGQAVERPPAPLYAGFWKRFAAYLIDWVLIVVASGVFVVALGFGLGLWEVEEAEGLAGGLGQLGGVVIAWLYYALMESGPRQATLGKQAISIRVTDYRGGRIGFGRASGRYFAQILSALPFMIGYLMAGWTRRKQALHDLVAGCLVVNREAGVAAIGADNAGRSGRGGLIGLVVVAGGILVAGMVAGVALPLYQDYAVRARVAAALAQVEPARRSYEDHYARHQAMPSNIADLWSSELPADVAAMTIGSDGAIEIVLGFGPVEGQRVRLVPSVADGGTLAWSCASADVEARWMPDGCAADAGASR